MLLLNNTSWLNLTVDLKYQNANESNIHSSFFLLFRANMKEA